MYNIIDKSDIYVYYNDCYESRRISGRYVLKKIGTEKQLIVFLAEGFFERWNGTDEYDNDCYILANHRFNYAYYDGWNRIIEPRLYYDDALDFYEEHIKTGKHTKPKYHSRWKDRYKYSFRDGNVECIRKYRGGPSVRPRKIKGAKAAYLDPEQKEFNRGSISDYPEGWWDDWNRCVERNWKSQRKTRHQWKEKAST